MQERWQNFRNVQKTGWFPCHADFRPYTAKMGIVDKAADYLKEAGMKVDIFTDVEANPSVTTVEKATEAFKEAGADLSWHLVEDLRWMLPKQLV